MGNSYQKEVIPDGKYFLTNVDYKTDRKHTKIAIICRDVENNRHLFYISYTPYFYIRKKDYDPFIRLFSKDKQLQFYIDTYYDTSEYDFYGKKLIKIECKIPIFVARSRDILHKESVWTYEADVLFHLRWLIDNGIKVSIEVKDGKISNSDYIGKFNIIFLDIEMLARLKRDISSYKAPVVIIGYYDTNTEEYTQLYFSSSNRPIRHNNRLYDKPVNLKKFKTEKGMLYYFRNQLIERKPDIILSFSDLDMKYVLKRMEKNKLKTEDISPLGRVRVNGRFKISGIEVLDIAKLYRKVFGEMKWHTLDFIANKEFNIGKIDISSVPELVFRNEWSKLLNYNLRDVELIVKLEEVLCIVSDFYEPIREIVGCNLNDTMVSSRLADILYLRLAHDKCKLPSRRHFEEELKYKGALVLNPKIGVHEYVHILDWEELYPSIIDSWNLGINTYDPKGDIIAYEAHIFDSKQLSWTTEIIKPLRSRRTIFKKYSKSKELDDKEKTRYYMKAFALKSIINAAYGLLAYQGRKGKSARLHDRMVAETVTYLGRVIMNYVVKICKQYGIDIIYGDTDSIFIKSDMKPKDIEQLILSEINKYCISNWNIKPTLKLGFDTTLKRLILLSKKRYKGITLDGEYIVKGIEAIRSDQALATSQIQTKVIDMFLNGELESKIMKYYHDTLNRLSKHGSVEELAIAGRCMKKKYPVATRNWKAYYYSVHALNIELEIGSRFYWVYIKSLPRKYKSTYKCPVDGSKTEYNVEAIAFNRFKEIPEGTVIDTNRMIETAVRKKVEELLKLVGVDLTKYNPSKLTYYT